MENPKYDLRIEGGGTVYLLRPLSPAGQEWIDEHIPADAQEFGGAIVVEHRYIHDIAKGAMADGLKVE